MLAVAGRMRRAAERLLEADPAPVADLRRRQAVNGQAGWHRFAHGWHQVDRAALLNHLIVCHGYRSYLEIGVHRRGDLHDRVHAAVKCCVDPDPAAEADYVMTSDAFMAEDRGLRFDLIFIDGLHTGEQVARDIENSLRLLRPGGAIMLHDLNPPTAFHARPEFIPDNVAWNGTSWEGYAHHRATRPDLEMYVVDADWGCGFVRPGRQQVWTGPVSGYAALEAHRRELLNLISVESFLQRHRPPLWRRLRG